MPQPHGPVLDNSTGAFMRRWGILALDFESQEGIWSQHSPKDADSMMLDQLSVMKSIAPHTRLWAYRNLAQAYSSFVQLREKIEDPQFDKTAVVRNYIYDGKLKLFLGDTMLDVAHRNRSSPELKAILRALRAHKINKGSSILSPQYSLALLYMARGPSSLWAYLAHALMRCKHLLAMACLKARCLFMGSSVTNQAFVKGT